MRLRSLRAPVTGLLLVLTGQAASAGQITLPDPLPRAVEVDQATLEQLDPVTLSANFVDRVIHDLPVAAHLDRFRDLDATALDAALDTRERRLAFWINIYNGYTQHFLKTDPSLYLEDRSAYFGLDQVAIANDLVSLEDIEHGVLRRGATTYTLGHVRTLFLRRAFIQRFAVDTVDYRIHFALNCGARSCPPVMPYTGTAVDDQLDAVSKFYLQQESRHDADTDRVAVPRLLRWFSADFDGGSDAAKRAILQRYGVIPKGVEPALDYREYDWTMVIRHYAYYQADSGR